MNKRHYEHTLPNIRGSLSNTYTKQAASKNIKKVKVTIKTNYAVFLMEKKEPGES